MFVYIRTAKSNNIDNGSPLGVSVYSKCIELVHEVDKLMGQIVWEYDAKEAALHVSEEFLKKDKNGKPVLPEGKDRLYRSFDEGNGDKGLFAEYSPEIRDDPMPDVAPSNWKATSYAADGITTIETVAVTSGSDGTDLGTMQYATRNGNLNSMQESAYGWNRWKYSAARQWLNSTQPKGKWWTKQDDWDIAPSQLTTKDGFLCGMPADMLAALKTVKVTTLANTVNDGGVTDITYDRVFLASMSQMNVNMSKEEGAVHEYWQRRTNSKTPIEPWKTYPIMIRYSAANHTSPQYVFSRSASRGNALTVLSVSAVGNVSNASAWSSNVYAPLVVV